MANTYTQLNVQVVFAVKGRKNFIKDHFKEDIYKYMAGILNNNKQYSLAVNGHKDHVHLFFELHPNSSLSDIIRIVKTNSSKWINKNNFIPNHFNWQSGYGGFTYSKSQRHRVINYIQRQEEHHSKQTFKQEYMGMLEKFEIDFDDQYVFEFYKELYTL